MSLRPLVIGPDEKQRIAHLVDFASDRAHWYHIDKSGWTPGDMPEYVLDLWTYRCVFTWSVSPQGIVLRHLSVSVPAAGKFPRPFALFTIADLFGFTGWDGLKEELPQGWMAHIDQDAPIPNAVLAQPMPEVTP